jgi:hypothetical protein
MKTKIENIWQDFIENDSLRTGIILKRYSADVIPDCFVSMRMPEKVKSIAFRISTKSTDISSLSDLKDITSEIIPDETDKDKSLILISLADNSLASIFAVLCEDLFQTVSDIEQELVLIQALQNRFIQWKELFIMATGPGLNLEKQIGLFGELYLLKKLFLHTGLFAEILSIWTGPETGIRDFEKNNSAIEVKTTHTHNHQKIRISSERQLDTALLQYLFLFHLSIEKRNSDENTLNTIVAEIYSIIGNNKLHGNIFKRKLINAGYFDYHQPIYQNMSFLIREEDFYKIEESFPRIEEKDLLKGVGDVKYSIILTSETEHYRTNFNDILQNLDLS